MVEKSGFTVKILVDGDEKCILLKDGGVLVPLKKRSEYSILLKNGTDKRAEVEVFIDEESVGEVRLNDGKSINLKRWVDKNRAFVFVSDDSYSAWTSGAVKGAKENGLIRVVFKPEVKMVSLISSVGEGYFPPRSPYRTPSPYYSSPTLLMSAPSGGYSGAYSEQASRSTPTASFQSYSPPTLSMAAPMTGSMLRSRSPTSESKAAPFSSGVTVEGGRTSQSFTTVSRLNTDKSKYVTITLRLVVIEEDSSKPYRTLDAEYQDDYPPPVSTRDDYWTYER